MKIVKPLTLGLLHRPYRHRGRNHFVIAAIGFFKLGAAQDRFLTENLQWPKVVQALPVGRPLDEIMPKLRGEALLAGHAYAPEGKPVTQMAVRLCVGGIDKTLCVSGDRNWHYGLLPLVQVGPPQPFTVMPLVYERAFGGADHPGNPVGCGHAGGRLPLLRGAPGGPVPNIAYPDEPFKAPWKRNRPAGFGALDMRWAPRSRRHGTFDRRWLERDAPGLAENVDWSLFNVAPEDQWLAGHFEGGECYRLEGVSPEQAVIEGRLPDAHARAFVLRQGRKPDAAEEVPLRMDTVWFLPDHGIGAVIYHGQTGIDDSDALDIAAVMIGYEHAGAPKPLAHYRDVLALRLDPQTAALHAFNEAQLAPQRSPEEEARRAARLAQETAARMEKQQALLDELDADFWTQSGLQPPPGHRPPQAPAPLLTPIGEQAIEDGDFDLSEMVNQARALAERTRAEGEAKLAELEQASAELVPPAAPCAEAQKAEVFERASVVAFDLLPSGSALLPPELAALLQMLEGHGEAVDPARREALRQTLLTLPALRRKARNAAVTPTAPAQPLLPEAAAWLGAQAVQWHLGGAPLAGRDLAGADLRGVDLSGADLREILLEQADLSGACFAGANLEGAVFTGAKLDGADFTGAKLANANFCRSSGRALRMARADLSGVRAIEAAWPEANLSGATLDDCIALKIDLSGATLDDTCLRRATLIEARADGSRWCGAVLDRTVALQASLEGADFSGAQLHKAVLMDARLHASIWTDARFSGIYGGGKADWSAADLRGARAEACGWHGASFADADLRDGQFLRCDFGQCDLSRADLRGGLFARSLFMRARLPNARAQDADFFQALLRKADLSCADLRRANLVQVECSEALFTGACLEGVRLDPQRRAA